MFRRAIFFRCFLLCFFGFMRVKSDCKVPPAPENGIILNFESLGETIEEYEAVEFECGPRYSLEGKHRLRCFENEFLDDVPVCIQEVCNELPKAVNGQWRSKWKDEFRAHSWVKLVCDIGYELVNKRSVKLKCKRNGLNLEWQDEIPQCKKRVNCGDPGLSIDGTRLGESFYEKETVHFACNDQYALIGEKLIVCQANGEWSSPRPRCRPEKFCPDPAQNDYTLINSDTKAGDYFTAYDDILISCKPGYRLTTGSDMVFCYQPQNEEGEDVGQPIWEDEIAQCEVIACSYPKSPTHGYIKELRNKFIKPTTTFSYKFEINFECEDGYRLIGASWSGCEATGWNEKTPFCRKVKCKEPGSPENGWKSGSSYEIGDKVSFDCFSGFYLKGSNVRTCLENGKWSGEVVTCSSESWYCPDPGTPESGTKFGNDYERGNEVRFECNNGYTLMGSEKRICQSDHTWDGIEATCLGPLDFDRPQEVSFRLLSKIDSAVMIHDTRDVNADFSELGPFGKRLVHYRRTARSLDVSYTGGNLVIYFIFDSSGSIGDEHFKSSIQFAQALVQRVGVTQNGVRFGSVTYGANVETNFYPVTYNDTDKVIEALKKIKYVGGGTATSDALKEIRDKHIPLTKEVLSNPKSIVFLVTDGVFNIGGNPKEVAATMKYEGVQFFCVAVSGKKEMNLNSLRELATEKSNLYQLHTYGTLTWMVDDVLNGSIDYSRCGLPIKTMEDVNQHARIAIKGENVQTYWPWMAALLLKLPKKEQHELKCGGSLIDREWILTAAHCLYNNKFKLDFKDVQVKLGITKLNNDSWMQHIEAKQIFLHPKYNLSNYDYDVALIKLKRPAEYKMKVRPICLSPSDNELSKVKSFLYGVGEKPTVTGFGYTTNRDRKMSDILRQVKVELQSQETCSKSLKNTNFSTTPRQFCAGDGTGQEDTCQGDSGGPLMQYIEKETGDYWIQIGIVSWGVHNENEACGRPGSYGFYTRIDSVVDWVNNVVKNN